MSVDMFITLDGLKGESTDDKHAGWIEVLHYSHHMSQPVSTTKSSAGGASTGRTQHGDFMVHKYVDLASPKLYEAVSNGKHFSKVTFEMCRAGGSQTPFMTITMEQVLVSNVQQLGPQGNGATKGFEYGAVAPPQGSQSSQVSTADTLPVELIHLNYGTIEWKYTQQKRTDGSGGGNASSKVDLTKGKTG